LLGENADPELVSSIERLAPKAEKGVISPEGLTPLQQLEAAKEMIAAILEKQTDQWRVLKQELRDPDAIDLDELR